MEKCPRCLAETFRYTHRCRPRATTIAVMCETCGYTGVEIPMQHPDDSAAAVKAAEQWNALAKAKGALKAPPVPRDRRLH